MSFSRYQRLTSGISHDLPTTNLGGNLNNVYPTAHQVPLSSHQNTTGFNSVNSDSFTPAAGQYNNTHTTIPVSPPAAHTEVSQGKTEI